MSELDGIGWLCISLRGSQRVATEFGGRLDVVNADAQGFETLREWLSVQRGAGVNLGLTDLFLAQKATHAFAWQAHRMFDIWCRIVLVDEPVCRLKVDGVAGVFRVVAATAWLSSRDSFEAIEGDDMLFIVRLRSTSEYEATYVEISERPTEPDTALKMLQALGVLPRTEVFKLGGGFKAGFYVLSPERMKFEEVLSNGESLDVDKWIAVDGTIACLFYCYLVCQRIERLLLNVNANGDWDDEYRKLLLVRKKLVAVRKCALLKNRALPGSVMLSCFMDAKKAFRLQEQIEHLACQTDYQGQVLEAHTNYISSRRIKSIETIVFVGTLLSLAVAINAIQMPPFFDQGTNNALTRPIFWVVVAVVVFCGVALWGSIASWPYFRKLLRTVWSIICKK